MVEEVKSWKAADGSLYYREEEAYMHDACKGIYQLLAGSKFVSYDDRYEFAQEIMINMPGELFIILQTWNNFVLNKKEKANIEYDKQVNAAKIINESEKVKSEYIPLDLDDEIPF